MMLFLEELFIIFRWFLIDEDEAAVQEQGIFWLSEQSMQKYNDVDCFFAQSVEKTEKRNVKLEQLCG